MTPITWTPSLVLAALTAALAAAGCATRPPGDLAHDSITSPAEMRACLTDAIARYRPYGLSAPSEASESSTAVTLGLGPGHGLEISAGPAGSRVVFNGPGERAPRAVAQAVRRCVTPP